MKIRELSEESVKVGLRIRSIANPEKMGTIVRVEPQRDRLTWILWDGEMGLRSAFHSNQCDCEVVTEENQS